MIFQNYRDIINAYYILTITFVNLRKRITLRRKKITLRNHIIVLNI